MPPLPGRVVTLAFNGTVAASGELTLVSKRLNFAYEVQRLIASFALGTDRTMELRYFISLEEEAPAAGRPTGLDLLSLYGEDSFLVGDDERKDFPHQVFQREAGSFIKVHALNNDSFPHTVDAQVVIRSLVPEPV